MEKECLPDQMIRQMSQIGFNGFAFLLSSFFISCTAYLNVGL